MFYKKNISEIIDENLFKNPTAEYRGTPFWAWNCEMDAEMLGEQIETLKKMGFGGFHMHSRPGMSMPYLKEEFMDLIKFCTDKAKKEDMLAYLYDEDRWPSGYAGGYATKNPKYRAKYIRFSTELKEHFPEEQAIEEGKRFLLAVYDIVLNENGELSEYKMIDKSNVARGRKWYVYIETRENEPWFNNQAYVDTLNKEAIDEFIKITYDTYKNAVGDEFGKTIPSIFTDEPQFVRKETLGFANSTKDALFPWTFSLTKSFKEEYGYDILTKLPEIIWNLPDNEVSTARYHYHNHVCDKFMESFVDNCGKWCRENGIELTGHMMEEDKLICQASALGEAMRAYRSFGIPGIDLLCNWRYFSTAKQCQSAVHQYGREAMLAELYGCTNWDFDFRGHKYQGDWLAALGVTIRVPHLSWVSMAGEAKRDYPASINYQSPWYKEYKYIEDHYARLNTALTRGKPHVNIAVIHPIESYWINFGPEENTGVLRAEMDKKFFDIIDWLLLGTVDFDFVSESLLPSQIKEINTDSLCVGEMAYKAVLVPDCKTLRKSTLDILESFSDNGGTVIFAGECPEYIDAVRSNAVENLYKKSIKVPYNKISVLEAVKNFREVEIKSSKNGFRYEKYIYNMRDDGASKWLFIACGKQAECKEITEANKVEIYVKGEYNVKLYNTLNGNITDVVCKYKNGKTIMPFDIYQNDSLLLKLDNKVSDNEIADCKKADTESEKKPSKIVRVLHKVQYERQELNALLLDRAEYSLNGEPFNQEEEILKLDNICREKMGWAKRCEAFAQPWVVEEGKVENNVSLKFRINSKIDIEDCYLAIEDAEKLEITLNDKNVENKVCGWYVDKSIKTVKLTGIKAGENVLVVNIPFGRRTNIEWCYILGDFNVIVEGATATITEKTSEIGFSDVVHQGLPFYGGNIIYKTEVETKACSMTIRANYYRGALIKVFVDGIDVGRIVFAPYEVKVEDLSAGKHVIEFVLYGNRMNTFGCMHKVIRKDGWIGPNYWRTTGDDWCYDYNLKRFGILASPIIEIYEK